VDGACGTHGRGEKIVQGLMEKSDGKRPLGKPRRRWEDGIRMDLREIGWEDVEWVQLAQYRGRCRAVVNAVMNLRILAPLIMLVTNYCNLLFIHDYAFFKLRVSFIYWSGRNNIGWILYCETVSTVWKRLWLISNQFTIPVVDLKTAKIYEIFQPV
jgi:hypothetical protein